MSLSISEFNCVSSLARLDRGRLTCSLRLKCGAVSSALQRDDVISLAWLESGVISTAQPVGGMNLKVNLGWGGNVHHEARGDERRSP